MRGCYCRPLTWTLYVYFFEENVIWIFFSVGAKKGKMALMMMTRKCENVAPPHCLRLLVQFPCKMCIFFSWQVSQLKKKSFLFYDNVQLCAAGLYALNGLYGMVASPPMRFYVIHHIPYFFTFIIMSNAEKNDMWQKYMYLRFFFFQSFTILWRWVRRKKWRIKSVVGNVLRSYMENVIEEKNMYREKSMCMCYTVEHNKSRRDPSGKWFYPWGFPSSQHVNNVLSLLLSSPFVSSISSPKVWYSWPMEKMIKKYVIFKKQGKDPIHASTQWETSASEMLPKKYTCSSRLFVQSSLHLGLHLCSMKVHIKGKRYPLKL